MTKPPYKLVLASTSKYRKQLLEKLGLPFSTCAPNVNERELVEPDPEQLAIKLAKAKADAVASEHPNSLVIGSDQVAWLDGEQLHKPGTRENNIQQLAKCSGQTVRFYTALCLLNTETGKSQSKSVLYETHFKSLSTADITNYVDREQGYDCAGGFKMEGLGISLFEYIRGDDPNALIGLPLIALVDFLKNEGLEVLG